MPTKDEIIVKVTEIIAENLGIDAGKVKLESKLIDDLGADSLDVVEMMLAFEDEFNLEISEDDTEGIELVGDVVNFLLSRLN